MRQIAIDELLAGLQDRMRRGAAMLEQGDVIIRNVPTTGFFVADALTQQTLEGPFPTLTDALTAARRLAITGTIWRQEVDDGGRSIGRPVQIPEFRVLVFDGLEHSRP